MANHKLMYLYLTLGYSTRHVLHPLECITTCTYVYCQVQSDKHSIVDCIVDQMHCLLRCTNPLSAQSNAQVELFATPYVQGSRGYVIELGYCIHVCLLKSKLGILMFVVTYFNCACTDKYFGDALYFLLLITILITISIACGEVIEKKLLLDC